MRAISSSRPGWLATAIRRVTAITVASLSERVWSLFMPSPIAVQRSNAG
jgi:hypothetical protein